MRQPCGLILALGTMFAIQASAGTPVSVQITVNSKVETAPPSTQNVLVKQDRNSQPVTSVRQIGDSPRQLLLLIDDSADSSLGTQIPELKKFIVALPPNTEVGVGYMHNGLAQMTSIFTLDHTAAANSVRLPQGPGGADVSPYDSLSDAVKKWSTKEGTRREVIMISSGIEGLGGGLPPENPYVNAGIASAIKGGVTVDAIYNPGFGRAGRGLWQATSGQNFLAQLTDETGGKLYLVGFGSAVSFEPFLTDILKRQSEQYMVTFDARAEKKSGLQPVKIRSALKGVSLTAPDQVYVKAGL